MVKLSNKIGWTQGTTKQQIFYKEKGEDSAAILILFDFSLSSTQDNRKMCFLYSSEKTINFLVDPPYCTFFF